MTELLTAAEAYRRSHKPYTLEEILRHIDSVADAHLSVTGYKVDRMPEEVKQQLLDLGYLLASGGPLDGYNISWNLNEESR